VGVVLEAVAATQLGKCPLPVADAGENLLEDPVLIDLAVRLEPRGSGVSRRFLRDLAPDGIGLAGEHPWYRGGNELHRARHDESAQAVVHADGRYPPVRCAVEPPRGRARTTRVWRTRSAPT
jgi:hypothetical protein